MASITEYALIASVALSLVSIAYYIINSVGSLKLQSKADAEGRGIADDVTIVVPVYNEDEDTFRKCISSLSAQGAGLVVVGDSSLEPFQSITKEYGGRFVHQQARRGKRGSISNAMRYVHTKYVLFVDSDTVVPSGAVKSMLSRFSDTVGGVGAAVSANVQKTNRVSYCSEFFEKLKEVIFRSMSMHGSVMVLDGRCAMYRTELVKDFMLSKEYTENRVLGKRSLLAEDRHLTSHVIKSGFKAVIDYEVIVVTAPQKSFKLMFKQMVRWSRAGYFYFFRELTDGTYFRRGLFYSFEMTYMYLFPIALVLVSFLRLQPLFAHGVSRYLSYQASHLAYLMSLNFAALGHVSLIYTWMEVLVLIGLAVFGIAIAARIAKGRKLKTLIYGIVALLMMFVASIYGFLTVWRQDAWLTR